jgi:hypothetical protein
MRSPHYLGAALAACFALTLTACGAPAPVEPEPTVEPSETVSAEPTPTAEPEAQLPAFGQQIIVVTARATASNGAVLDLTYTAYEPVESGSDDGQAILAYLAAQGDTSAITTGTVIADEQPLIMPFEITAVAEGSTVWPTDEGALTTLGARGEQTYVGIPAARVGGFFDYSIIGAGEGYAFNTITNLPGRPLTVDDWPNRFGYFGFDNFSTPPVLSQCSVFVTPYAEQFEVVANEWDVIECFAGVGD